MTENKYVRASSGVWKLDDSNSLTPTRAAPEKAVPPPASTPSGLNRTPSRGLPADPKGRGQALAEQAKRDRAAGNLASAETNLRLALTFDPGDPVLAAALESVVEERTRARRAAGPKVR
jgi:hypothetical protein